MDVSFRFLFSLYFLSIFFCAAFPTLSMETEEDISFKVQDRLHRSFTIRPIHYAQDSAGMQRLIQDHKQLSGIDFLDPEVPDTHSFSVYEWRDRHVAELLPSPIKTRWVVIDDQAQSIIGDFDYYDGNSVDFLIHPHYRGNGLGLQVQRILLSYFQSRIGDQTVIYNCAKNLSTITSYPMLKDVARPIIDTYRGFLAEVHYQNVSALRLCLATMSVCSIDFPEIIFEFPSSSDKNLSLTSLVSNLCSSEKSTQEQTRKDFVNRYKGWPR